MNPIEEAFGELKAWCKKHRSKVEGKEFDEFLEYAMQHIPNEARGHFAQCMVGKPIHEGSDEDYYDD